MRNLSVLPTAAPSLLALAEQTFFEYTAQQNELPEHYQLEWIDKDGSKHTNYDPYDFGVQLPEFDRHLFAEGKHWHIYQKMGAHQHTVDNIEWCFIYRMGTQCRTSQCNWRF